MYASFVAGDRFPGFFIGMQNNSNTIESALAATAKNLVSMPQIGT
jgi:hypothetical protein